MLGDLVGYNPKGIQVKLGSGVGISTQTSEKIALDAMKQGAIIPRNMSAEDLIDLSEQVAQFEQTAELFEEGLKQQQQSVQVGLKVMRAGQQHQRFMNNAERTFQQIRAEGNKDNRSHALQSGINQAKDNGNSRAYEEGSFDSM